MVDEEGDQNLVRVRVDSNGVDVSVSRDIPNLLARLLPGKLRVRRSVNDAILRRILEKIYSDSSFDEAEVAFAEALLLDPALKYIRLKYVQQRSYTLLEETHSVPFIEGEDAPTAQISHTSDDWVNKFREDASLVDDELVREIYARVLAEEAKRPTSFSLRTLGVLRYLDREAATAFGQLQKVLLNYAFVPQQSQDKNHVLQAVGLDHSTMLMLEDAGLVNSSAQSALSLEGDTLYFVASGYGRILAASRTDNAKIIASVPIHLLTPAGKELAQIVESESDEAMFMAFINWLRQQIGGAKLQVATLPSRGWSGAPNELTWKPVTPDDKA